MHDGEYVKITPSSIQFFDFKTGKEMRKKDEEVAWGKLDASKGGWDHFMLKEIMEQRESLGRVLAEEAETIARAVRIIKKAKNIFLVACGTAGYASMVAERALSEIAGVKARFVPASEFRAFLPFVDSRTVVIPVTQSGETADVLEAIKESRQKKAKIVSVINVRGSSVERESDAALPINAGPEKAVASTKAATSQILMFLLLAHALSGHEMRGRKILKKAVRDIGKWLEEKRLRDIRQIAERVVSAPNLFVIGKGMLYPVALEAALKIKEVSYIHAEGFAAGELKHGPIALIEQGTPCIALLGDDENTNDVLNGVEELKARGAFIIGIAPQEQKSDVFDAWIPVPDSGIASALTHLIPTQILAYYLAVLRGNNPDKPRNLAKSVTVK